MPRKAQVLVPALGAILALTFACSKSSDAPTAPSSAAAPGSAAVRSDGSTLKVPAPTLVSPLNDVKLDDAPTLVANAVAPLYTTGGCTFQYDFELYDPNNVKVATEVRSTPSFPVTTQLAFETRHTWRVRAVCPTSNPVTYGPWSATGSFISSTGGYIRGNEVYDPLINGKTVGQINGPVTFIPGVGVRLESESSWITYNLSGPVVTGEMSLIATGIGVVSSIEDPKNSLFSMAQNDGHAFNDNPYRMSVDVRGNGDIAWRFLTGSSKYIETVGAERMQYSFHEALTYFVQATWDGGYFNVLFKEGGAGGNTIYNFGKGYSGSYTPNPAAAYAGRPYVPGTRDSPSSWQGAIIRQVWVSSRPRPASANK